MRKRVLWIEDEAYKEASQYSGPVLARGLYDLDIALDTEEGIAKIIKAHSENKPYDAIIIDIRFGLTYSRAGIDIIRKLLNTTQEGRAHRDLPAIEKSTLGILSVEGHRELEKDLKSFNIEHYRCKDKHSGNNTLLDLIKEIVGDK